MTDQGARAQVAAQCKAVCHLATVLAQVHGDYEKIFADESCSGPNQIVDIVGHRTASFMERLGNMLNAMDAATEDDAWLDPIFAEAQRRWPQTPPPADLTAGIGAPTDEFGDGW